MKKSISTEEFIGKTKQVHGDKYDYSKTEFVNGRTKVCIICPIHGEFWQLPYDHLYGRGCFKCRNVKHVTTEEFIEKARKVHSDKYDYSKVDYVKAITKVCIICPEHGEFWQRPNDHLNGCNCPKCADKGNGKNGNLIIEEFVRKARKVHGDKYDYSKVEYKNNKTKICIICPIHGEFWQRPDMHLHCKQGCPKCASVHNISESRLFGELENEITNIEYQKRFKWLGKQSLDFYLPDYNIAIEYQGEQHFKPVVIFGGDKEFKKTVERDIKKKNLCEKHGIELLYFTYNNKMKEYDSSVFTDINDLLYFVRAKIR